MRTAASPNLRLGPYELRERLGEGGSGQVYRADGPTGVVAVKILGPSGELDEATGARFRREIAALSQLDHGNLVKLLDHGVDAELGPYLVLPVLAGAHLRAAIGGAGAVCPEAAILLARPIVGAIAALHAAGYVHRDVKPENVIASPDGGITVIDLGLAWREGMTRHTESGAAVGSVGYMAPEQIDGRTVAASADIWALGVLIYEWICGRRPFARGRPAEEAAAALIGTFAPLGAADRRVDDELAALVGRCLSMDPAKRPTADALGAALDAMIDWCGTSDGELATERAAILADAAAYQAKVAPFRVRRAERRAREALDAGQPFVALARCDRGLAYAPEHPALVALVAEAERASGERAKPRATASPTDPSGEVPASGQVALATASPPSAVQPRHRGRTAIVVGAVAVVAVIATLVAVKTLGGAPATTSAATPTRSADPWNTAGPSADTASSIVKVPDDKDRATIGAMVGLLGHAFGKVEEIEDGKARDKCVALAGQGAPDAIDACDAAVKRHPDDPVALAARAIALLRQNKAAEAVADLDRAIAVRDDPRWRRIRAVARTAAGDAAGAGVDLARACEMGDAQACKDAASP